MSGALRSGQGEGVKLPLLGSLLSYALLAHAVGHASLPLPVLSSLLEGTRAMTLSAPPSILMHGSRSKCGVKQLHVSCLKTQSMQHSSGPDSGL